MPRVHLPAETVELLWNRYGREPFRYSHVVGDVVTAEQLRATVERGLVKRVRRGEYQVVSQDLSGCLGRNDHLRDDIRAALDTVSGAVVSHHSAALLHGLPNVGPPHHRSLVNLTRPGDHHSRGEGYLISGSGLSSREVVEIDGMRVTSLARTAVDLARMYKMPDGLAVMDAAAREMIRRELAEAALPDSALREAVHDSERRRVAAHTFRSSLKHMSGWKGVGWARLGVSHLDPAAESVLESISRWAMIEAEFPLPKVGWPIRDVDGVTRWADFYWKEHKLIGEADGALKYTEPTDLLREKHREEALRMMGFRVVRWGWHEAVNQPHLLLGRLDASFRSAA